MARAVSLADETLAVIEKGEFERVNEIEDIRKPLIARAFVTSVEPLGQAGPRYFVNSNQSVIDKLELVRQSIVLQQVRIRQASKSRCACRGSGPGPRKSSPTSI